MTDLADLRSHKTHIPSGLLRSQEPTGRRLPETRSMTIDLILLKPYFQGSNQSQRRAILGRHRVDHRDPPQRTANSFIRLVDPQSFSDMDSPALQTVTAGPAFAADHTTFRNRTYFALELGLKRLSKSASGKPTQGTTMDHRPQRSADDRSAPPDRGGFRMSSRLKRSGYFQPDPLSLTCHGFGAEIRARCSAGSPLSVPNS